jgi:hypothetical protein
LGLSLSLIAKLNRASAFPRGRGKSSKRGGGDREGGGIRGLGKEGPKRNKNTNLKSNKELHSGTELTHPMRVHGRARQLHVLCVLYLIFAALFNLGFVLYLVFAAFFNLSFCTVLCTEAQSQIELGGSMAALGSSVY